MADRGVRLVILDRDGVINFDSPEYVRSPAAWRPIPGSLEAIAALNRAGFTVAVASNQSGVGRGYFSLSTLYRIHRKMRMELARHGGHIDRIVFCPHRPDADCDCRKPQPGLIERLLKHYELRPEHAVVVGDSARDLIAGRRAGVRGLLVLTGNGRKARTELSIDDADMYPDLAACAVALITEAQS